MPQIIEFLSMFYHPGYAGITVLLGNFLLGHRATIGETNSIAATMYAAVTSPEDMVILQLFVKVTVFFNRVV